ncbi:MAG: hypothetical protein ABF504_12630, partial [Komagataeibacter saccharivorans]|uniref:hypothetical protein n=1 Tax=Komagataeibacter saccharivorans TaxID=265959 RepID=UPI0039E96566
GTPRTVAAATWTTKFRSEPLLPPARRFAPGGKPCYERRRDMMAANRAMPAFRSTPVAPLPWGWITLT